MKENLEVDVLPLKSIGFVKCPRCSQCHGVRENFDNLCDKCCGVMLHDHPDHPASVEIRRSYAEQRTKYIKAKSVV